MDPFSDPQAVARYAEGPPRFVPGYGAMQRMTTLLLAERVPEDARVLVLGAGGGLELKAFAQAHPGWTFDGIDPAAEMLKLAERTLGPLARARDLHQGYIDDAPEGPFDAATCLLDPALLGSRGTATYGSRSPPPPQAWRALRGRPLLAFRRGRASARSGCRDTRLDASGIDPDQAARAWRLTHLTILSPEQDEAILREAGFSNVSLFYAGFTFRGWVAYA